MELARLAAAVDDLLLLQLLPHPHSPPQSATMMVPKRRPQLAHHPRLHRLWLKPLHEQQQLERQRLVGRAQPLDGRTTSGLLVITTSTSTAASGRTTLRSPQRQATAQPRKWPTANFSFSVLSPVLEQDQVGFELLISFPNTETIFQFENYQFLISYPRVT